ncbi:MAG: Gfo/Idh/MocA family oxidoreductase [SAR324 cluster bacterium]|nr:Gfo/Idh/MocA family oxidoreductase [SAR324 cluster bacterium]
MPKNFAITGVAGYVAPRHLKAIKDTENRLLAALDPHDSVGMMDQYFPNARFFTEYERFDRHLEKLKREGVDQKIHYLSICSPNYLHDAHIRMALRIGADAICEKPLVLNPWNLDALAELEAETGRCVYTILQFRVHPTLLVYKKQLEQESLHDKHEIELTYITSRGHWYLSSWKGNPERSGGLATNIGVHFFDMLIWLFGDVEHSEVHYVDSQKIGGFLELERARVRWFLSIDYETLPETAKENNLRTFRSMIIDGQEIEFSGGFTELHTKIYQETLQGRGFVIDDTRPAIQLVCDIRGVEPIGIQHHSHPFLKN